MRIAVSYARVSTNKEEQKESLINQKEHFMDYAKRNDLILDKIYADEGISGTKTKNRKEFQRMMRDAELGLFQVLLVKDVSRLARNTYDFLSCLRRLQEKNIEIVYLSYSGQAFAGEFMLTFMAALAQEESRNTSGRIKFGKQKSKENGIVPNIVFGYDKVPEDKYALAINPDEAELVQEIFNLYTKDNMGVSRIAIELNQRGFQTKRGCDWSNNAIGRILRNPIYTGKIINGKQEVVDFLTSKRERKAECEWHIREYEELRLISDEQFAKAQEIFDKRSDDFKLFNKKESNKYLFSTLIKCNCCNRSFRRINRKDYKEPRYVCYNRNEKGAGFCDNKSKISEAELLQTVTDYFANFITNKDNEIIKYAREIKKKYDADTTTINELEQLDNDIESLKAEREKEIEMFKLNVISGDELQNRTKPINIKIENLEKRKACFTYSGYSVNDIAKILRKSYKSLEDFGKGEGITNEALKKIISKIQVGADGGIEIFVKPFNEIGLFETVRFTDNRT